MESLNLCDYPWIPIAGDKKRKSLMQIFSEQDLPQLSGNPVDKIMILRLLLCIVHASNPLPDADAWDDLTLEQMAENARAYLQKWHDRFDLYGEKPFLQFPKLAEIGGKATPLSSLMVSIAEGNKVVFSGWNRFQGISPAETIILLLRTSGYSCGGKKFDNSLKLTPGVEKGAAASGGPLLGFMGYLHSCLQGKNLLETLRLNLLTDEDIADIGGFSGLGTPFWENMPQGEYDSIAQAYRKSYLGELFPLNKFMLLKDGGIIKTDGISYPALKTGLKDPALTFFDDKKTRKAVWARTEVHPWRELPALLAFLKAEGRNDPPYFLSMQLPKLLRNPNTDTIRIWTGGMAVSFNAGEQYLSGTDDYVESSFSIAPGNVTDGYENYKRLMLELDNQNQCLYRCVSSYYKKLSDDAAPEFAQKACGIFWDQLESHAQTILDLAFSECDEEKIRQEKSSWFRILCQIYNDLCPHETPRQIEAWVNAHPGEYKKNNKGNERRKNESGKQM